MAGKGQKISVCKLNRNHSDYHAGSQRKGINMGLLDQVMGAAAGLSGQQGGGNEAVLGAIMQLVNNPQAGGLSGLIQSFQNGGLGEIAKSWVSTGQNLPISAEQIQSVLGNDQVRSIAGSLGLDADQVSSQLAQFLPQVIDQLTPEGTIPEGGDLMTQGMNLLKGKLFG
jgi:uncharacterized protein YidB (DUF937 family)